MGRLGSVTASLTPPAFVWCIAGPHIGETLVDIVERKRRDVERFGWCLWAYGGTGNAHPETEVRRLARDYALDGPLPLLMPDTGERYPDDGAPFGGYRLCRTGSVVPLPVGMSPVTGGRSSWAFWLTSLAWSADATIDVSRYVAPYTGKGVQPLTTYLKVSHGRACAALGSHTASGPTERRVDVVAELTDPYAVFLPRDEPR